MNDTLASFARLEEIVAELRQKCPWDREQTTESLRHLSIEEVYELSDAILQGDPTEVKIELGDILLHIFFYVLLAEEKKEFTMKEMVDSLIDKLIRRHPHVYGDLQADTYDKVMQNWEKIKGKENKAKTILSGVPQSLPSLIKAYRMQEKAASAGFDWEQKEQVWDKVKEEMQEFEEADNLKDKEAEMGDLLFSLVNYCRFAGINPEDALARTNQKFKRRFEYVESQARAQDRPLDSMSLSEMEGYWQEAKKTE